MGDGPSAISYRGVLVQCVRHVLSPLPSWSYVSCPLVRFSLFDAVRMLPCVYRTTDHRESDDAVVAETFSWRPDGQMVARVANLSPANKKKLCDVIINVGAACDWGVEPVGVDDFYFRYFTDMNHLANLFEGVPVFVAAPAPGANAREVKRAVYRRVWMKARGMLPYCALLVYSVRISFFVALSCRSKQPPRHGSAYPAWVHAHHAAGVRGSRAGVACQ